MSCFRVSNEAKYVARICQRNDGFPTVQEHTPDAPLILIQNDGTRSSTFWHAFGLAND